MPAIMGLYNVFPIRQVQIYKRTDLSHFHQKELCSSINHVDLDLLSVYFVNNESFQRQRQKK